MATINVQRLESDGSRSSRYLWEALGNADQGTEVIVGEKPDGSIQVVGTFGGATVVLEGTNDGTNWVTLTDDQGAAVSFTAAGLAMFVQRTWKVRVSTSGGTGTDVDAYLLLGG